MPMHGTKAHKIMAKKIPSSKNEDLKRSNELQAEMSKLGCFKMGKKGVK